MQASFLNGFVTRSIQPHERQLVDKLRVSEYRKVPGFSVDDETVLHTALDPAGSTVLGTWDGDLLVGTVRLTVAKTEAEAQGVLGMPYPIHPSWLPGVALCRGAVLHSHRGRGLMPYLLTLALAEGRRQGARAGLGAMSPGTAHQRGMLAAGWVARPVATYKSEGFSALTSTDFMLLEYALYEEAVRIGQEAASCRKPGPG